MVGTFAVGLSLVGNVVRYRPDPAAPNPALPVVLFPKKFETVNVRDLTKDQLRLVAGVPKIDATSFKVLEVDTGLIRTFAFYWANPSEKEADTTELTSTAVGSIAAFERQRGSVISDEEQPILVGKLIVRETEARQRTYSDWTHLKQSGADWMRMIWPAGAAILFAMTIYLVVRALGWIINGFVSQPKG